MNRSSGSFLRCEFKQFVYRLGFRLGSRLHLEILLCVSRRPSGRLEVIQLMRMMDDMLEKAGVDQHFEELTEISQVHRQAESTRAALCIYD